MGLGDGAVEDGEGVAGFKDVGAHGEAHDAGADPADFGGGWGDGSGGHGVGLEERERRGSVLVGVCVAEERD